MKKKWYKVMFYAEMDLDDVKAMSGSFFDTMASSMGIAPCEGLTIEEDTCSEEEEAQIDLTLVEGDYTLDEKSGQIKIDAHIASDLDLYQHINIEFEDEDSCVNRYVVIAKNDNFVYCDFLENIK